MRKLLGVLAIGLPIGLLTSGLGATQAQAAPLGFVGALTVVIPIAPAISVLGGGVANVTTPVGGGNHLVTLTIPASPFNGGGTAVVTNPTAISAGVRGLSVQLHNGTGMFTGSPLAGPMPINGISKICLLNTCGAAVANITVPLNVVGVGGAQAGSGAGVAFTVIGAPWTAGVAAVGTITQMGFAVGPAGNASSTAQTSGLVRLVTPIFITTANPALAVIPGFAFLDLHFVPEPGTLLLVGSGIAGLVMLGRSKRS